MSKYVDSIIGHAIGDAMGVPTEFGIREKLLANPVTKMIPCVKEDLPAGCWSDDTSMEIATMDSFIQNKGFNYADIMDKWTEWLFDSKYTASNKTFDVGTTCLQAIKNYSGGIDPLKCGLDDLYSNGNGSLMRILPVALYAYSKELYNDDIVKLVNDLSSLTHAHDISKLGCFIYVKYVIYLLEGLSKEEAYKKIQKERYSMYSKDAIKAYDRILKNDIKDYKMSEIKSSGYVVDTLECALWILLNADNYKDCIIASTNIGQDTDTIGAITGSMAGIIYGIEGIPEEWLNELLRKEYLINIANEFEETIHDLKK